MKISNVRAIEILDSRGNPTVRAVLELEDKSKHTSSVPSGASTGTHEAVELRDGDVTRYGGHGVLKAVENVNKAISKAIVGHEANPKEIDKILIALDGKKNKSNLGANAILSVSMATARAAAHAQGIPLWKYLNEEYFSNHKLSATSYEPKFPRIMVNIINGGRHANWNFDIQEFMVVPNSNVPAESVRAGSEIFHSLGNLLKDRNLSTLVGDEGGYSPALSSNEEVFEIILEAAKKANYENGRDFRISIDAAASEFYKDGKYYIHKPDRILIPEDLAAYYSDIGQKYNLLSIEDPFAEDDWEAWKRFTKQFEVGVASGGGPPSSTRNLSETNGENVGRGRSDDRIPTETSIIIGDDLFTTSVSRMEKGIREKAANGIIIKLNQIGTVTETAEAINLAKDAGWKIAVSHRSGETEDTFIADLAYASNADFIKSGSMSRSERLSKYNRLLEVESNL